jgi:hypothetical protein
MERTQHNLCMMKADVVHRVGKGAGKGRRPIVYDVLNPQRCIVMHY